MTFEMQHTCVTPNCACPFNQAYSDHSFAMPDPAWPGVSWQGQNGGTGSGHWASHYVGAMPECGGVKPIHAGGNLMSSCSQRSSSNMMSTEQRVGDPGAQKDMGVSTGNAVGRVERQEAAAAAAEATDDEPIFLSRSPLSSCSECPFCKIRVGSRDAAIRCIRRDMNRIISAKCPKCRFREHPGESLRSHYLRQHTRLGQLPCRFCKGKAIYFWTKAERLSHEYRAHRLL